MPLVLPLLNQIAATLFIKSAPIHDSFQAIIDKFNGQVVDADISGSANISGAKLGDGTIVGAKLADLTIATGKLANLSVETGKIAAASIGTDKLKVTIHTVAISAASGAAAGTLGTPVSVNPTVAFPKATYDLYAVFAKNLAGGVGQSAVIRANDVGTNWAGDVATAASSTGPFTITGTAVWIFISKV